MQTVGTGRQTGKEGRTDDQQACLDFSMVNSSDHIYRCHLACTDDAARASCTTLPCWMRHVLRPEPTAERSLLLTP
eukprot:5644917-Pleurochrysis_carterae.AAC.1